MPAAAEAKSQLRDGAGLTSNKPTHDLTPLERRRRSRPNHRTEMMSDNLRREYFAPAYGGYIEASGAREALGPRGTACSVK